MAKLPIRYYSLVLLVLVIALTGCELRRDSGDFSDPDPVADVPPTLAPLGSQTEEIAQNSTDTEIVAEPAAVEAIAAETDATTTETEPVAEVSEISVISNEDVAEASSVSPETVAPSTEEASAEDIIVGEEAIVVDATSEDLPVGGPVAANPPASQTVGDYAAPVSGDTSYTVQSGDTLYSIATRYETSVQAIIYSNGLPNDFIYAGQELMIPAGDVSQYDQPIYNQTTYEQPVYGQPTYQQPDYGQPTYEQPVYSQPYTNEPGSNYHTVAPGETLYRIALQYGTSVDAIAGANGIPFPYIIQAGQPLAIPAPGAYVAPPPPPDGGFYQQPYAQPYQDQEYQQPQLPSNEYYNPAPGNVGTHTIAPGETLYSIALQYGTTAEALAATNGLYNPNQIYVGQVLYLP